MVPLVAPIDKLSVVLVAVFGVTFLGERLSGLNWLGVAFIASGAVLVAIGDDWNAHEVFGLGSDDHWRDLRDSAIGPRLPGHIVGPAEFGLLATGDAIELSVP